MDSLSVPEPRETQSKHQRKKSGEKFFLEHFLRKWAPDIQIVRPGRDDGKEPDFFIDIHGSIAGIELSQIFKEKSDDGSLTKRHERYQQSILAKIIDSYYQNFSFPIHVSFFFTLPDDQRRIEAISLAIGKIAASLEERAHETFTLQPGEKVIVSRWPNEIGRYTRWQANKNHMGWARWVETEHLQNYVDGKSSRLSGYKTTVEQVFLLLYSDRTYESGMLRVPEPLPPVDSKGFAEVFLYLYPEDGFHRIDKR